MGIIARYVRWTSHDAGGTLPPLDVVAGIVQPDTRRMPAWWPPLGVDEAMVLVPAQWIGEWDSGHTLAPAYQYLWRVPRSQLRSLPALPQHAPYRPDRLPASATGPRQTAKDAWRSNR